MPYQLVFLLVLVGYGEAPVSSQRADAQAEFPNPSPSPETKPLTTPDAPATVMYFTIDRVRDRGHGPNSEGIRAAAAGKTISVQQVWAGDQRGHLADFLKQSTIAAVILSGSYTEWYEQKLDPSWVDLLHEVSGFIKTTQTPLLAICGSH